jgi:hypothetical protein
MKLRELLTATALISSNLFSANAFKPEPPSPLIAEDKVIRSAYYDTLKILTNSKKCSDFFGGSSISVEVFNELMSNVRKSYFSPKVGIEMSGGTTDISRLGHKNKYRVFGRMSINGNGPFYRRRIFNFEPFVPGVGTFQPNTREVRVLMLLHELGHVVQTEEGKWVLPDDGNDQDLSRKNTRTVESVCGGEIRNLGKGDTVTIPVNGKASNDPSNPAQPAP